MLLNSSDKRPFKCTLCNSFKIYNEIHKPSFKINTIVIKNGS